MTVVLVLVTTAATCPGSSGAPGDVGKQTVHLISEAAGDTGSDGTRWLCGPLVVVSCF